jgi:Big-like domain-containing protein
MNNMSFKKCFFALSSIAFCVFSATTSHAALNAVGPLDANIGLPVFYQDRHGVALAPCLDTNGFCILPPQFDSKVTDTANLRAISSGPSSALTPDNFPAEVFYFVSDVTATVGPNAASKFALRTALEGGFSPVVADGNQVTFIKTTLQPMTGLTPNSTYTVIHPYGSFIFGTDASGATVRGIRGEVFVLQEGCSEAPCAFTELLPAATSSMGPFLRAAPPSPPAVTSNDGKVYIADPGQAVKIEGSPTRNNNVTITGPDIGGTGVNTVTLTDFHLSGKLALLSVDKPSVVFPPQRPGVFTDPIAITVSNLDPDNTETLGHITIEGPDAANFSLTPGANLCTAGNVLAKASGEPGENAEAPAGSTCTFSINLIGAAPDGTKNATINVHAVSRAGTLLALQTGTVNVSGVIDTSHPGIGFTVPANNAINVPLNNSISVTFDKPVQPLDWTMFVLATGSNIVPVNATVAFDAASNTAVLKPAAPLQPNTTYNAALSVGVVTDIIGNPLAGNFNLNFITGGPDNTPPAVLSVSPRDGGVRVPKSAVITATFNVPMDPTSVNGTTFAISTSDTNTAVAGSVTYDTRTQTATFTPNAPLAFNQQFTAKIAAGVSSLGSNTTANDFTWSFTTNQAPTAPQLFAPQDTGTGIGTTVDFQWVKSTDNENLTYHLYYCTNSSMLGCSQVDLVTSTSSTAAGASPLARAEGYGMGLLFAGFAIAGGVRTRKKIFFIIAVLLLSGLVGTSCHHTDTNLPSPPPPKVPVNAVTLSLSTLQPATTYWWKVVADDGNGGKAESETWSFTTK